MKLCLNNHPFIKTPYTSFRVTQSSHVIVFKEFKNSNRCHVLKRIPRNTFVYEFVLVIKVFLFYNCRHSKNTRASIILSAAKLKRLYML